ncbi:hypothetical protein GCM10007036_34040 [Alsobacter metallidurans]|uniref:TadE-like domain-containing protein n=1 Tax=Alsobacter metallidurans TaxID=340221 RepID=A0A917IAG8_9HYPH|nr:TadE/TadG family type IV pilus assembly protein [Alsobacter metallidurans]GGH26339.1 hypothetical protein GCM10007036_34040 [Alsobacter metallidurans]
MILHRFRHNERGSAAVEAALILPVIVALCFATVVLGDALVQYRRAVKAAASLLDVAVEMGVSDASLGVPPATLALLDHGMKLAMGEGATGAKLILSRVTRTDGIARMTWTTTPADPEAARDAPVIGRPLLNGETVLVADVVVDRRLPINLFGGRIAFRTRFLLSPSARNIDARSGPRWTS